MKPINVTFEDRPVAVVSTLDDAAAFVGVTARTIQSWIKAGCPGERGAYVPADIVHWRAFGEGRRILGPWR